MRLPMLLDIEPWIPLNKNSARDSAKTLMARAKWRTHELNFDW
jgi:hypothetical protein